MDRQELKDFLTAFLFPKRCRYCTCVIKHNEEICGKCEDNLHEISGEICFKCGCSKEDCVCKNHKRSNTCLLGVRINFRRSGIQNFRSFLFSSHFSKYSIRVVGGGFYYFVHRHFLNFSNLFRLIFYVAWIV